MTPRVDDGGLPWAKEDLNLRPHPYQGCALTKLSYWPGTCDGRDRSAAA